MKKTIDQFDNESHRKEIRKIDRIIDKNNNMDIDRIDGETDTELDKRIANIAKELVKDVNIKLLAYYELEDRRLFINVEGKDPDGYYVYLLYRIDYCHRCIDKYEEDINVRHYNF